MGKENEHPTSFGNEWALVSFMKINPKIETTDWLNLQNRIHFILIFHLNSSEICCDVDAENS